MSEREKSEVNPYESPREAEPLMKDQIVKRAVGVGALILLTPPAMIVAVLCCCSGAYFLGNVFAGWIVLGGPFVVLAALMATGIVLDRNRESTPGTTASRTALFIGTPFVVAGATVAGFFLAAVVYPTVWMLVLFFIPPALTLLIMLLLIWQAK